MREKRTERKEKGDRGFSLTELMVMAAIVASLTTTGFIVFANQTKKVNQQDPYLRTMEAASALEVYKKYNNGELDGVDKAFIIEKGYSTKSPISAVQVCPDWSGGATSVGNYTILGWARDSDGNRMQNTGFVKYDSSTDQEAEEISDEQKDALVMCETPIIFP